MCIRQHNIISFQHFGKKQLLFSVQLIWMIILLRPPKKICIMCMLTFSRKQWCGWTDVQFYFPGHQLFVCFLSFFFTSVSFYVLLMCGEVMTLDMQCIHKCSDAQTSEKGMGTLTEADSCFCQDDIWQLLLSQKTCFLTLPYNCLKTQTVKTSCQTSTTPSDEFML